MIDDVVVFCFLVKKGGREGGRKEESVVCGTGESGGSFGREVDGVEGYARLHSLSLACVLSVFLSLVHSFPC